MSTHTKRPTKRSEALRVAKEEIPTVIDKKSALFKEVTDDLKSAEAKENVEHNFESNELAIVDFLNQEDQTVAKIQQHDNTAFVVEKIDFPFNFMGKRGKLMRFTVLNAENKMVQKPTLMMVDSKTGATIPMVMVNWHATEFTERETVRAQAEFLEHVVDNVTDFSISDKSVIDYQRSKSVKDYMFSARKMDAAQLRCIEQRQRLLHFTLSGLFFNLTSIFCDMFRELFVCIEDKEKQAEALKGLGGDYFLKSTLTGSDDIEFEKDSITIGSPGTPISIVSTNKQAFINNSTVLDWLLLNTRVEAEKIEAAYTYKPVMLQPWREEDPTVKIDLFKSKEALVSWQGKTALYEIHKIHRDDKWIVVPIIKPTSIRHLLEDLETRIGHENAQMIEVATVKPYWTKMVRQIYKQANLPLIAEPTVSLNDLIIFHTSEEDKKEFDTPLSDIIQRVDTVKIPAS